MDYVVPNPAPRVRKVLSNTRSHNPSLLTSIASFQTLTTLSNDFEQTVYTLKSAIRATKITTTRKQRIYTLTGGQGGRRGHGGGGPGGGGNHYQNKRPYKGGRGGRGIRGERGSSDKHVQLNEHCYPPNGMYWVDDKFYELGFYANLSEEQKTRLHELRNNRSTTTPETQKGASVELQLLQLEQLNTTLPPPQSIVASHQGVSQVGVQPQYTNATNLAIQRLKQRR